MKALLKRSLVAALALVLVLICLSTKSLLADEVVKSFSTKSKIDPGWVVSISSDNPSSVELTTAANASRVYGVVVDQKSAAITLQQQNQQIFVASSGNFPVLVSTENGPINTGDYLSISSNDGIADKATRDQTYIIGQALSSFDGKTNVLKSDKNVAVGLVTASISPGKSTIAKNDLNLPNWLLRLSGTIAGKRVSSSRVYAALLIFLITVAVAGSLVWIGVRTSIISIGRNPLSKHFIIQGLAQVIAAAIVVFICGLAGIYFLLKL